MNHLGDITKINGAGAPPVNVIIGGSPCQDLSVAGKRAGLAGERSGLFMEQIRIIKEMRAADGQQGRKATDVRPRYMVWENVPGAFSSHKGQDFRAVLEETIKIVEPQIPDIPIPDKGWSTSGCIMGEQWSIAWRVFDAQFWGVPQRRRRIALVADFGGQSAPEILFERKGVSRHTPPSRTTWKDFAAAVAERFGGANKAGNSGTAAGFNGWKSIAGSIQYQEELAPTIEANMPPDVVYDARGNGNGKTAPTITGDHKNRVTDYTSIVCMATQQGGAEIRTDDKTPTLTAAAGMSGNNQPVIALDRAAFNQGINAQYDFEVTDSGINSTITAKGLSAVCAAFKANMGAKAHGIGYEEGKAPTLSSENNDAAVVIPESTVRRLTPLECERLQGFPDGWTDIGEYIDTNGKKRKTSDTVRYKALGNSIALPSWVWLLERLSYCCGPDRTMASLFDGIGGFPLIWETLNGEGSCLWASEIEEFPIAVTKNHFSNN